MLVETDVVEVLLSRVNTISADHVDDKDHYLSKIYSKNTVQKIQYTVLSANKFECSMMRFTVLDINPYFVTNTIVAVYSIFEYF